MVPYWLTSGLNGQVSADTYSPLGLIENFNHFLRVALSFCHVTTFWFKEHEFSPGLSGDPSDPDSFDGPMQSLTKEWLRAVGVTQDGFRRRTAEKPRERADGKLEGERTSQSRFQIIQHLPSSFRRAETALLHTVPRRAAVSRERISAREQVSS